MFFENFHLKNKLFKSGAEEYILSKSILSDEMKNALLLWDRMYQNKSPWLAGNIKSLNLAAAICNETARMTTIDLKISVNGSERGAFLEKAIKNIIPKLRSQVEYACAYGGIIMKPYISKGNIQVDFIKNNSFIPSAVSCDGRITSAVFIQQVQTEGKFLTRLEEHSLENSRYIIQNTAFVSNNSSDLGRRISLRETNIWNDMEEKVVIENMERPLFVYFKVPFANTIDSNSPLGVSVFSRAADLIEEADRQYSRLIWEFQSGERALYLDETAFKRDKNGKPILPDKRLYKTIDSGENDLFHDWSPVIRDESILRGLDNILVKIEDLCGLARGSFSKADAQARTATELKILRQRSYSTITDMQNCLKNSLEELLSVMDIWCELAGVGGSGKYSAGFEFDDSIVCDSAEEFEQKLQLVSAGIMSRDEFRRWYFGEDSETSKINIPSL